MIDDKDKIKLLSDMLLGTLKAIEDHESRILALEQETDCLVKRGLKEDE